MIQPPCVERMFFLLWTLIDVPTCFKTFSNSNISILIIQTFTITIINIWHKRPHQNTAIPFHSLQNVTLKCVKVPKLSFLPCICLCVFMLESFHSVCFTCLITCQCAKVLSHLPVFVQYTTYLFIWIIFVMNISR